MCNYLQLTEKSEIEFVKYVEEITIKNNDIFPVLPTLHPQFNIVKAEQKIPDLFFLIHLLNLHMNIKFTEVKNYNHLLNLTLNCVVTTTTNC